MLQQLLHFFRAILPLLLIPPAGLLWVVLAGRLIRPRRPRLGRGLIIFGLVALYVLSMPAFSGLLIEKLEGSQHVSLGGLEPKAIIVLGADGEKTQDPLVKAEPGPLSMQRLTGAAILARATGLPVLISGGRVASGEPAVADLMADTFETAFGLPVKWRENESANTCENARLSAAILRKAGIESALVVTHSWHMPRAILSFERAGYPIVPAPLHGERKGGLTFADFLPHTNAWIRSFYAIHEWTGLIAYHFGACPATPIEAPSESLPPVTDPH
jgi:uncharacterized SAM-binding protein YcdF (DUF218 family)